MKTLGDLITRAARFSPDDTALVCGDVRFTHRQHLDRARRLASALHRAGCGHQDRVAVLAMNGTEYAEAFSAAWLSGYILATVNFRLAAPEMAWVLGDTAPRVLIFEDQYTELVGSLRAELPSIQTWVCIGQAPDWAVEYEAFLGGGDPAGAPLAARPEDIAHIIYTSGTTGRPKGVMRSHRNELAMGECVAFIMDVRPRGRMLEVMPMFHAGAQSSMLAQMWRGGQIHIHRGFDPGAVLAAVREQRITHLHLVPLMVQALVDHPDFETCDLSSVETVLYAAAPMPVPVLRRALERLGPVFVNAWGQTEGTGSALPKHLHAVEGPMTELLGSIGHPYPLAEIRIVDDQGQDCAPGQVGELWIRGDAVMVGYWNNTAATIEAFHDGWLKTGDMGRFDDCERIFLVDRKKDMIISGGENIYSQEVERAIAEHPAVSQVAVIGAPDPKWGEKVVACVILNPGAEVDAEAIIAHTAGRIASYKKPKQVLFLETFPALPSGKVNKVALRALHAASHG
ncbi:long-chain-fatty-acid--CoA ligase [Brevundimonas sp.]|uniref:class I adenylate-forming enzyme family protein n=1 Tax=Brevundimonas sp. TaxID=1871086 RepID=UPI002AB9F7A9|nr:long-chain-fatty-acid--CoA ligase [Brevundimonas sp.]MDZ4363266.1 long-chain-fatty-acid--CoA ligase [Brevundimonas sp.]